MGNNILHHENVFNVYTCQPHNNKTKQKKNNENWFIIALESLNAGTMVIILQCIPAIMYDTASLFTV